MEKKKIISIEKTMSLDLAERMIRVEQTVCASFHKPVKYNETEFFKNMSTKEQQDFNHYLKNKKKKRIFFACLIILPLFFVLFLELGPTGNIIKDNLGTNISMIAEVIVLSLIAITCIYLILLLSTKMYLDEKMKEHSNIITNMLTKKHHVKRRYSKI